MTAGNSQYAALKLASAADARTREIGLQQLLDIHRSAKSLRALDMSCYEVAARALYDDVHVVRFAALDLIFVLAQLYPAHRVEDALLSTTRPTVQQLADDAFEKICDAIVNDESLQATQLLGDFTQVSLDNLLRTLTKKAKRSVHATSILSATSAGPALSHNKHRGKHDWDSSGFKTSVAGAFVHALEDEFHEVRGAALGSIRRLSALYEEFALEAVDFLVDMINDEIDAVRRQSVDILADLCKRYRLELSTDQLDHFVTVLEDPDIDFVHLALQTLGYILYKDQEAVAAVIRILRTTLMNRPADHLAVLRCLRSIGTNNASLIATIHKDLLKIDPRFQQREQKLDDLQFISKLALVLNAGTLEPSILRTLPRYIRESESYLAAKYPGCFTVPDDVPALEAGTAQSLNKVAKMLDCIYAHIRRGDFSAAFRACQHTMQRLPAGDLTLLLPFLQSLDAVTSLLRTPAPQLLMSPPAGDVLAQLRLVVQTMQHMYLPCTALEPYAAFCLRLCELLSCLSNSDRNAVPGYLTDKGQIYDALVQMKANLPAMSLPALRDSTALMAVSVLRPTAQQWTRDRPLVHPCLSPLKVRCSMVIHVADSVADPANLLSALRLQIVFPDRRTRNFSPLPEHITPCSHSAQGTLYSDAKTGADEGATGYRREFLMTTVVSVDFDTAVWSEAACLRISPVLCITRTATDDDMVEQHHVPIPRRTSDTATTLDDRSSISSERLRESNFVEIETSAAPRSNVSNSAFSAAPPSRGDTPQVRSSTPGASLSLTATAPPTPHDSVHTQIIAAKDYLEKHNISELFTRLTARLVAQQPDDPRDFLVQEIRACRTQRTVKTPTQLQDVMSTKCSLFTEADLVATFRIFDPSDRGVINLEQYMAAMRNLGAQKYNRIPEGAATNKISLATFVYEAKQGLSNAM
ncbi:hypothetical protein RI367_000359 [Sorochytrium milnesiophthora]